MGERKSPPGPGSPTREYWRNVCLQFRHTLDFRNVRRFCLFVGYPRSGHSMIGAMLNAHPRMVIAHEAHVPNLIEEGHGRSPFYARILREDQIFQSRGNKGIYEFAIPNQWQGRFETLEVIGDKRGGAVTRQLEKDPEFLAKIRQLTGVPLRMIHAIRNPFDNISAISLWQDLTLDQSIDFYFDHCRTTSQLERYCGEKELINVYHEDLIHDPKKELLRLCEYLEVLPSEAYVKDATSVLFPSPTYTRRKLDWKEEQIERVNEGKREISFLERYTFDDDQ